MQRKLSTTKQMEVYLKYLAGKNIEKLQSEYSVSRSYIRDVLPERIPEWNSALITEMANYHVTPALQAEFILSGFESRPNYLPFSSKSKLQRRVHDNVYKQFYEPLIHDIVDELALQKYIPHSRSDVLMKLIDESISHPFFVAREELLNSAETLLHNNFSISGLVTLSHDNVLEKVRRGGSVWSDEKRELLQQFVSGFKNREQELLAYRLGKDNEPLSLSDIARIEDKSRESVRAREDRLRKKFNAKQKQFLYNMAVLG